MSTDQSTPGDEKYWYNARTHEVEKGAQSSFEDRMGPYDTAEQAQGALEEAKQRNQAWDAEDKDWNG